MCTHAYIASAFGASRLHGLLAEWPRSYAEAILRTARPGWETAGVAPKRRHFHDTPTTGRAGRLLASRRRGDTSTTLPPRHL